MTTGMDGPPSREPDVQELRLRISLGREETVGA